MRAVVIYAYLLMGLFYFSEGKPCPEKSRPHLTLCDAYYKCRELASNSHVWVPIKCNEGLVYEHSVGSCVLPGEDWECLTASELVTTSTSSPGNGNILIVNNKDEAALLLKEQNDDNVEIVLDATMSSEEEEDESTPVLPPPNRSEDESTSMNQFDSSGDGELVELDGLLQENREGEVTVSQHNYSTKPPTPATTKEPGSTIDPKLTAHLQRLSQLIDGLQQTYQKTEKPQLEMRPDQLNAFLAHFDLKNRYDMINPLEQTTTAPERAQLSTTMKPANPLPEPTVNKTRLQEHLTKNRMQPETKLMLSNSQPFSPYGPGYANSQIVVNHPEGSVMFTLPQYGLSSEQMHQNSPPPQQQQQQQQQQQHQHQLYSQPQSHEYSDHEPKISEETLKTVLELSKQMIAAQNLPKVLPNPAYNGAYYAPPILQPVILSPHNNPFQQYYSMQSYESPQPPRTQYVHHKKTSGYNKKQQAPTTIIHNNVIPVHLSSTNSGEKEVLDTYGNSLGVYPNLDKHNNHNNDQMDNNNNNNNYYNKFIATMTTARPSSGISVTTMSSQYGVPYGSDYSQTTPSPSTVATYYTASPHLNENNVNSIFQTESYPTAMGINMNLPRPMDAQGGMFPTQLEAGQVKIRPNAQKIESMEVEADEANYANGNGNGNSNNDRHNLLTYSSSTGMGMNHQLAPSSYVEQQQQQQQQHQYKVPYMPRPTTPSLSSTIYSDTAGNLELNMYSTGSGTGPGTSHSMQLLPGKPKYPTALGQLVNFNGNFISLDVFQKSIMPLMTQSPAALSELGNVEVITCQAGVRQPNQTDCTRYFVCSKKDGKVLSYSCPPYTGFNKQTRICDATTYAQCGNMPIFNGYSIDENRRLQLETLKVLAEAKRRQEAAMKAQNIANLLQQYGNTPEPSPAQSAMSSSMEQSMLDSYMVSFPEVSSTPRPTPASPTFSPLSSSNSSGSVKKRKYYCKEGDKIPDQTSISSYFVCYKNAQGQMKGHKMTCSKALLFCPKTLMCTLASKCTG